MTYENGNRAKMKMDKIEQFQGKYRFLSNFWPCVVELDGEKYPSVEHAYVAAKSVDKDVRRQVAGCVTPGDAKRLGRKINIREDWDDVKVQVMYSLLKQKFSKSPLKNWLLDTGVMCIEEGNTWGDTFWGVYRGKGKNTLGKLLMDIRKEIGNQKDNQGEDESEDVE